MDTKFWTAIGALITTIVGGAIWIGTLRSDVNNLANRVQELEKRPLAAGKVTKGDICYKLADELGSQASENDSYLRESISDQIAKFDCYKGVPASTNVTSNALDSDGPTNAVQSSAMRSAHQN